MKMMARKMKADDLFKKMGWKKEYKNVPKDTIQYRKQEAITIKFNTYDLTVIAEVNLCGFRGGICLDHQTIKAINMKLYELEKNNGKNKISKRNRNIKNK